MKFILKITIYVINVNKLNEVKLFLDNIVVVDQRKHIFYGNLLCRRWTRLDNEIKLHNLRIYFHIIIYQALQTERGRKWSVLTSSSL